MHTFSLAPCKPPNCRLTHRWTHQKQGLVHCNALRHLSTVSEDVNNVPLPKGRMGWPVIGRTVGMVKDPEFLEKEFREHGPISKISVFGEKAVVIAGIERIKQVMFADPPVVKQSARRTFEVLLGTNGLFVKDDQEHTRLKSIVMKTMVPSATAHYIPYITESARRCLKSMAESDGVFRSQDYLRRFTFDILTSCIVEINTKGTCQEEILVILNKWTSGAASLGINLPFTKFSQGMRARKKLIKLVQDTMKSIRERDGAGRKTALELLMEAKDESGSGLTDIEIVDNILTLIAGGYDTSALTIMAVLHELQQNNKVLEQAVEEQEKVVAEFGEELNRESLGSMVYLQALIQETLRVNPTFKSIERKAVETFEIDGYRVPKGWQVIFSIVGTGKVLDERWLNDHSFNPSRFLKGEGTKPGAQIPWGLGPHKCIGQGIAMLEMKIFLSLMIRGYDYHITSNKKPSFGIVEGGMPMTVSYKAR